MEPNIEDYLNYNCIPYKKDIVLRIKRIDVVSINYIIPHAIIKVKSSDVDLRKDYEIERIVKQFNLILAKNPNLTIYYYVWYYPHNITREFLNEVQKYPQVKIIYHLSEIKFNSIPFYTNDIDVIRTMVSKTFINSDNFEYYFSQLKNNIIFGTNFYRAISILNDTEMSIMGRYNYMLDENFEIKPHIAVSGIINQNKKKCDYDGDLWKLFNSFEFKFPVGKLDGHRTPIRIIEGITAHCVKCNSIYIIDSDQHQKKCDIWRLKKLSNRQS